MMEYKGTDSNAIEGWVAMVIVALLVLFGLLCGLWCGCVVGRRCLPRRAEEDRCSAKSTQTGERDIFACCEFLLIDLQSELAERGWKARRLKRDCVQVFLELDSSRLDRPARWRRLAQRGRIEP